MDEDKKPAPGRKVEKILTWVAILYRLTCLLDWLLKRKWGLFLILAVLGTLGSALIIALVLGMIFDMAGDRTLSASDAVVKGEWIASAVFGIVFATVSIKSLNGKLKKRKIYERHRTQSNL